MTVGEKLKNRETNLGGEAVVGIGQAVVHTEVEAKKDILTVRVKIKTGESNLFIYFPL